MKYSRLVKKVPQWHAIPWIVAPSVLILPKTLSLNEQEPRISSSPFQRARASRLLTGGLMTLEAIGFVRHVEHGWRTLESDSSFIHRFSERGGSRVHQLGQLPVVVALEFRETEVVATGATHKVHGVKESRSKLSVIK